jgi:nucleotide-binding universal stress UspA family protein
MTSTRTGSIVVGYDDYDAGKRALERALEEAKTSGAALVVVSVLELPLDPEGRRTSGRSTTARRG